MEDGALARMGRGVDGRMDGSMDGSVDGRDGGMAGMFGGDERVIWQSADSSRQGLNGQMQVYSHLCLFPNESGRNIPSESQPVLDTCANL